VKGLPFLLLAKAADENALGIDRPLPNVVHEVRTRAGIGGACHVVGSA